MIKAGIIGGSNPKAGELIRLLINHPDVAIMWVDSARFTGRLVSEVHHGLIGETDLRISPKANNNLDEIDVLFIFRMQDQTVEWLDEHDIPEDLCIVDLSVDMRNPAIAEKYDFVYGQPELNRKAMVRGAKHAVVPHPVANLAELALMPLAKHALLMSPVRVDIAVPADAEQLESAAATAAEITMALRELQPDFDEVITLVPGDAVDTRAMKAIIHFDTTLDIDQMQCMYEEFYDDHNFTFIIPDEPSVKEVAGTNKCLIQIDKRDGRAVITAVMDAHLKGAVGTAVHDMNLLFGLHEKVGLELKASIF